MLAKLEKVEKLARPDANFSVGEMAALRVTYADMEAIQGFFDGDGYALFAESDERGQTFECYDPECELDPMWVREGKRKRLAEAFPGVTFEYPDHDEESCSLATEF